MILEKSTQIQISASKSPIAINIRVQQQQSVMGHITETSVLLSMFLPQPGTTGGLKEEGATNKSTKTNLITENKRLDEKSITW